MDKGRTIIQTVRNLALNRISMPVVCFICGALGAIPYYCEELFVFTFISLFAQFYIAITQRRAQGKVFLPFFMYFLGFYSPLYLFLSELYPYERFGFTESQAIFIVICSCVFIPMLHASVEALITFVSKYLPDNGFYSLGIASLWVIGEWVLSLGTLAFPWANISVSLTGWLSYLQTASLFGRSFITFITVFGCCALAMAVTDKKRFFALLGAAIIALNAVVGTVMWFVPTQESQTVSSAVIQGNVLSNEKWSVSNRGDIFDRYVSLTKNAAQNGAKLIVLPESAIPISFKENGQIHEALAEIAAEYNATVITGITYYENSDQYNSVIAVLPDGTLSERYDKRHLVPFGEFIPFVDIIGKLVPFVGEFNEDSGAFVEGDKAVVIKTEYGDVAPLVCFDSIFPRFAAEGVENGADMLAIVTNDSWFNDSVGIYTHLRHAQVRAIENRRYVLRAANTGISAFIDEQGRITDSSVALTVDTVYADVAVIESNTLYYSIGDITLYISFIIIVILIIYNIGRTRNGKNTIAQD